MEILLYLLVLASFVMVCTRAKTEIIWRILIYHISKALKQCGEAWLCCMHWVRNRWIHEPHFGLLIDQLVQIYLTNQPSFTANFCNSNKTILDYRTVQKIEIHTKYRNIPCIFRTPWLVPCRNWNTSYKLLNHSVSSSPSLGSKHPNSGPQNGELRSNSIHISSL